MVLRKLLPAFSSLGLLCAVYLPAFVVVSCIRPRVEWAIPLVIGISLSIALLLIFLLNRKGPGFRAYGFAVPRRRYVRFALLLGLPFAFAAVWLSRVFPSKPPFDVSRFPFWMIVLYFVVAAPIQEEVIFRGLIQSFLQQRWQNSFNGFSQAFSSSAVWTAMLFSVVHLAAGPAVIIGAMVLALLTGELRRRSGSLVPAVLVHALFNLTDSLWPGGNS
jgi:membrane protease YdiL (CAAX protease family)